MADVAPEEPTISIEAFLEAVACALSYGLMCWLGLAKFGVLDWAVWCVVWLLIYKYYWPSWRSGGTSSK